MTLVVVVVLNHTKNAHAVPLASARQRPENQKENQAEKRHNTNGSCQTEGGGPMLP